MTQSHNSATNKEQCLFCLWQKCSYQSLSQRYVGLPGGAVFMAPHPVHSPLTLEFHRRSTRTAHFLLGRLSRSVRKIHSFRNWPMSHFSFTFPLLSCLAAILSVRYWIGLRRVGWVQNTSVLTWPVNTSPCFAPKTLFSDSVMSHAGLLSSSFSSEVLSHGGQLNVTWQIGDRRFCRRPMPRLIWCKFRKHPHLICCHAMACWKSAVSHGQEEGCQTQNWREDRKSSLSQNTQHTHLKKEARLILSPRNYSLSLLQRSLPPKPPVVKS